MSAPQAKDAHVFEREQHDWYVEPSWAVDCLIEHMGKTPMPIWDPACGMGTIPKAFESAGIKCLGTDLVDRGYGHSGQDFLKFNRKYVKPVGTIVTNPPYKFTVEFIEQGLRFADVVAVLVPLKFLASNSRNPLFQRWPTSKVLVLSSRPSMLPGHRLLAGEKAAGGAIDYCWIVFDKMHTGPTQTHWLMKPGAKARPYNSKRTRKVSPEAALSSKGGAS